MKIFACMAFLMIFFSLFSCKEKVTDPEEQTAFSFSSGKCRGNLLEQGALQDSSFEYTFNDNLFIDFTVSGNCGRFFDLPNDHYVIICTLKGIDNPIYIVNVFRSDLLLLNSFLRRRGYS